MGSGLSEHDHSLSDGATVHIRPIRPDDAQRMIAMWARLSVDTIFSRFFGIVRLDESNVDRHVDLDPTTQAGLVAVLGRGADERIVSMARYDRLPNDSTTAELSVLVEDAHQRRGIGTALLRHTADAAHEAGVRALTGDVLANNTRMLRLLDALGFRYQRRTESTVVHATFGVQPTDEYLAAVTRDEKRAAHAALSRFLRPRSVAVVGAGSQLDRRPGLLQPGRWPLCRRRLPGQPARGGRAVGRRLPHAERLPRRARSDGRVHARAHGLRVIGPNCMGVLNGGQDVRLNATFSGVFPAPGRIGFLYQSGALGLIALERLDELGLGVGTFVSVGNKADISGNDLLLYWEDDPQTEVILLYLESFGNPRRFARIARQVSRRKPILAVKARRTGAGQRAASSHTAAMSAGDVAVDALFRQAGVIRADTLEELFATASLLATQPPPKGRRVGIITNGGGPGILAADACEAHGLEVLALSDGVRQRLEQILPPEAGTTNPVDMIASSTAAQYGEVVRILGAADEIDALMVIFVPPIITRAEDVAAALVQASAALPDKPLLSVFMGARGVPPTLAHARIPSFAFPEDAALALGRAAEWGQWRDRPQGSVMRPTRIRPEPARAVVAEALSSPSATSEPSAAGVWLSAAQSDRLLGAYGIPLAPAQRVRTAAEAARAQQDLGGAVVVKPAAAIHKSDVGALRFGLTGPEQTVRAVEEVRVALGRAGLAEHGDELLVQQMIPDGVEMAVGVMHDPLFGPLMMVGFGGTLVELLRDVAVRITPVTDVDVEEMLRSLKAYRLLTGYRGSDPGDVHALTEVLYRLNALVEDIPEIAELDLNPVFVRSRGVVAVDVRIRVAPVEFGSVPARD